MNWKAKHLKPNEQHHFEKTGQPEYVSDNTTYNRWATEIEMKPHVVDGEFMERNNLKILNTDKFPALANYEDPRMVQLRKLRNIEVTLAKDLGLTDTCEELVFDNIDDIQVTRGTRGFYTKSWNTQRMEMREEVTPLKEKAGRLSRWFGGNKDQEQQQVSQ
jgi:hypothetical protein